MALMFRQTFLLFIFTFYCAVAFADCVQECMPPECLKPALASASLCQDSKMKCEIDCKEKKEEDDDTVFTGIKLQNGNTLLMQGERIAAGPAAFSGKLRPEDLAYFEKEVVYAEGAGGTISYSERKNKKQ